MLKEKRLEFCNLSTIIPCITVKQQSKLPKEFAIVLDGNSNYNKLIKLVKNNINLNNTLERAEIGDYLLFTKNDIYLEDLKEYLSVESKYTVYSLTYEYSKIEKIIRKFFNNVYSPKTKLTYRNNVHSKSEGIAICGQCPLINTLLIEDLDNTKLYNNTRLDEDLKVTIFPTYVKIGYDVYVIRNLFGKKYVQIEGQLFKIKKDWKGEYLTIE